MDNKNDASVKTLTIRAGLWTALHEFRLLVWALLYDQFAALKCFTGLAIFE